MTGSPQTDTRLEPLADDLMSVYGWTQGAPIDHAANILAVIDAADEAAGIRRVSGELHDALMRLYHVVWEEAATMDEGPEQRYVVMSHEDSFKVTEAASAVEDLLFPIAADSPVGGGVVTGDAVRQLLAEISERANTAIDGPWEALPRYDDYELVGSDRTTISRLDSTTETVEFIAAARSDVPRLVAALTAVLDRHRPVIFTGWRKWLRIAAQVPTAGPICATCDVYYPCGDVKAVAAALQEQP